MTEIKQTRQRRAPREDREEMEREVTWAPASALPEPKPLPGYRYRWVRSSMMGSADPINMAARMREQWDTVDPKEQPHLRAFINEGMIEVGGLILCKMPEEVAEARARYYNNQTNRQMESVDNHFMRDNDPRMPLFRERRSEVSFGNGS